jgi:hypothetical protein
MKEQEKFGGFFAEERDKRERERDRWSKSCKFHPKSCKSETPLFFSKKKELNKSISVMAGYFLMIRPESESPYQCLSNDVVGTGSLRELFQSSSEFLQKIRNAPPSG